MYYTVNARDYLVLPRIESFRELVLEELYALKISGHIENRKTMSALSEKTWWFRILFDINNFIG